MDTNKKAGKKYSVKKRVIVALAAGLYPFLHYYGNNFNIANSYVQFFFLIILCFAVPIAIAIVLPFVFKLPLLRKIERYGLTAFNFLYFTGLLGFLIFHFKKGVFTLVLLGVALLGFLLYRFLNKIVILQFLLAVLSLVTLIPNLYFAFTYDDSWTEISEDLSSVKFKQRPNIYVIQPDGYANFSDLRKPPYDYMEMGMESYLEEKGFVNYKNFRSNYFTTLSSNSATFAMKHHYYDIISKRTAKTFGTQEVIVGDNNTLRILKNNKYKTHLFTDNLFFLLNRKLEGFDYFNIPEDKISFHRFRRIVNIDIAKDLGQQVQANEDHGNFYFIEKTVPGHIRNSKSASRGIEVEREKYLEKVEVSNDWISSIIKVINDNDENPLIVLMADHGGYVGLAYLSELDERKLNALETSSVYSVMLSVKWPNGDRPENLTMKSNVNLFRNLFYYLSEDELLLDSYQPDTSIIYTMENNFVEVYQCIDENGKFEYVPINSD